MSECKIDVVVTVLRSKSFRKVFALRKSWKRCEKHLTAKMIGVLDKKGERERDS